MNFQGKEVVKVVEAERISEQEFNQVKANNQHYYALRHGEEDWSIPVTIEHGVLVNYWGYMITKEALAFPPSETCIDLSEAEGYDFIDMRDNL